MIGDAIFSRLSTDGGVNSLVSTRIYPLVAKEGVEYPLITYQQIDSGAAVVLDEATSHFRTLQQIDIYSRTRSNADAIANAVRASLDHQNNQTWGGVTIAASTFDQQFDSGFDEAPNLHRIIQQYRISWKE